MYQLVIVDDEPRILNGLCKYYDWHQMGFEISGRFRNGKEVLDHMKNHTVDVILSDISMPVMDGISLAKIYTNRILL